MKKILITLLCLPLLMFAQSKKQDQEMFETLEIKAEMPLMEDELKSVNGFSYSLKTLTEKNGIIVLFTCNTCPFVVKWEDRYKLTEELAKKNNLGLVYINSNYKKRDGDDSYDEMKKHAKEMNYRFPYLLDEKTISISGLSKEINEKEQKILSLFGKKRNVSNSEIMDLFLEQDKTKDFAVKKKNKTILSLNEKLFSVFKIEFISKKKSKSDSRQLTYFLNKKVRILEEGAI